MNIANVFRASFNKSDHFDPKVGNRADNIARWTKKLEGVAAFAEPLFQDSATGRWYRELLELQLSNGRLFTGVREIVAAEIEVLPSVRERLSWVVCPTAIGVAIFNPADKQFNYKQGRELALNYALASFRRTNRIPAGLQVLPAFDGSEWDVSVVQDIDGQPHYGLLSDIINNDASVLISARAA